MSEQDSTPADQLAASRKHTAEAHEAAAVVSDSVGDDEAAADHRSAAVGRHRKSPVGDPPDEGGAGEVGAETGGGQPAAAFDNDDRDNDDRDNDGSDESSNNG
jgi:hypothetical protein